MDIIVSKVSQDFVIGTSRSGITARVPIGVCYPQIRKNWHRLFPGVVMWCILDEVSGGLARGVEYVATEGRGVKYVTTGRVIEHRPQNNQGVVQLEKVEPHLENPPSRLSYVIRVGYHHGQSLAATVIMSTMKLGTRVYVELTLMEREWQVALVGYADDEYPVETLVGSIEYVSGPLARIHIKIPGQREGQTMYNVLFDVMSPAVRVLCIQGKMQRGIPVMVTTQIRSGGDAKVYLVKLQGERIFAGT